MSTEVTSTESGTSSGQAGSPLLRVTDVVQTYQVESAGSGKRSVQAVSGVSFEMIAGETLTLVGESGCGKSSLARAVLQLPRPTSGSVFFNGSDLTALRGRDLGSALGGMQLIFQDPFNSLDPHWKVRDIVAEPLRIHHYGSKAERYARADELIEAVGLSPIVHGTRHSRELSGGQAQRVAIARSLALNPKLVVCDEPVSALDVSIQAQILNLFEDLREEFGLSYLFITHDLAIAKHVSDRIAVMYLGKIVELSDASSIFSTPHHPYSAALLSAIPDPDVTSQEAMQRIRLTGDLPSASNPPSGCRFRTRCPYVQEVCAQKEPPLVPVGPTRSVACHFPLALEGAPNVAASGEVPGSAR